MPRLTRRRRVGGTLLPFFFRRRGRAACLLITLLVLGTFLFIRYRAVDPASQIDIFGGELSSEESSTGGKARSTTLRPNRKDHSDYSQHLRPVLEKHTWEADGLLVVNREGEHPIYELIEKAEAEWATKHERASRTLEQAVREYERRYRRPPPMGFEHWWNYAVKHKVPLPDEYDQIYMDLEPYWGIDPAELSAAEFEHETLEKSFTIGKLLQNDVLSVLNFAQSPDHFHEVFSRIAKPQIELMGPVHRRITPFRALVSSEVGPTYLVDWSWKQVALDAAKAGKFLKHEDLPPVNMSGFAAACPPRSPLYENPLPLTAHPEQRTNKTFIYDHRRAMDPCLHPSHLLIHSEFLKWDSDPVPHRFPVPIFSYTTTSLHADIHMVSVDIEDDEVTIKDPKWEEKSEDRVLWRGKPDGMDVIRWRDTQRARFVDLTRNTSRTFDTEDDLEHHPEPETIDILPSSSRNKLVGAGVPWNRLTVNNASMDTGFTIEDVGDCDEEFCDFVDAYFGSKERLSLEDMGEYKYLVDVDGDGRSDQFRRLMSTNSLVFKSTLYPEWYLDRIQPWVHYVPIQLDYSDLYDALSFFSGDIWGDGEHDDLARKIALAGRQWVSKYWRKEDMVAYMFRLWLEYARVVNVDREVMNFELPR